MTNIPAAQPHALALGKLEAAAKQLQDAKDNRARSITDARKAGLTWAAIGEALGITGPAAYHIIDRAGCK